MKMVLWSLTPKNSLIYWTFKSFFVSFYKMQIIQIILPFPLLFIGSWNPFVPSVLLVYRVLSILLMMVFFLPPSLPPFLSLMPFLLPSIPFLLPFLSFSFLLLFLSSSPLFSQYLPTISSLSFQYSSLLLIFLLPHLTYLHSYFLFPIPSLLRYISVDPIPLSSSPSLSSPPFM